MSTADGGGVFVQPLERDLKKSYQCLIVGSSFLASFAGVKSKESVEMMSTCFGSCSMNRFKEMISTAVAVLKAIGGTWTLWAERMERWRSGKGWCVKDAEFCSSCLCSFPLFG